MMKLPVVKYLFIIIFGNVLTISHAQNNKQNLSKPPVNTTTVTNSIGSYFINYEIKSTGQPAKTGKVFYASDNIQFVIAPSNSGLKDVTSLRMLIDLKASEVTMLTIDKKNKKSGLLTKLPMPVISKTKNIKKPPVLTKTGIFKTITGFKCEKTLINIGDSVNIEAYITTDISIDVAKAITLTNSSLRNKSPFIHFAFEVPGTVLECIVTKKNCEVTKLNISDIKKGKADVAAFSMSGYSIMDARGLPVFNAQ